MRNEETRTVPAQEQKGTFTVTCDLCGAVGRTKNWNDTGTSIEWRPEPPGRYVRYPTDETRIVHEQAEYDGSPDGSGTAKTTAFDCCHKCFEDKVVPALVAIGLKPVVKEYYF